MPVKHKMVIEQEAGVEITSVFDLFLTALDLGGLRMPNPEFIRHVLAKFPDVSSHEAFIVGDTLDRSLSAGRIAGIRTVLFI